jgi:hypothetical protein
MVNFKPRLYLAGIVKKTLNAVQAIKASRDDPKIGHPCKNNFALRQSGDLDRKTNRDFRPMTLCRQVSLGLPFGSRSVLTSYFRWF